MQTTSQPAQPISVELGKSGGRANSPLDLAFESKQDGVISNLTAAVTA
jgi:hypothetical protein